MRSLRSAIIATTLLLAGRGLAAQPPAATPASPAAGMATVPDSTVRAIEAFARLQRAVNALRDREQAELAEPRNKKVDAQGAIRDKYRKLRADSLAVHGFSPAQVNAMTLRIASDDALRGLFETTMERLGR